MFHWCNILIGCSVYNLCLAAIDFFPIKFTPKWIFFCLISINRSIFFIRTQPINIDRFQELFISLNATVTLLSLEIYQNIFHHHCDSFFYFHDLVAMVFHFSFDFPHCSSGNSNTRSILQFHFFNWVFCEFNQYWVFCGFNSIWFTQFYHILPKLNNGSTFSMNQILVQIYTIQNCIYLFRIAYRPNKYFLFKWKFAL